MDRREAIRLLAVASSLPLVPTELLALLRTARKEAPAGAKLQTLDALQNDTVIRLAEIILPETDTPGATAAHVDEFIDLMLTEWYGGEDRKRFLDGLGLMNTESNKLFGKSFPECNADQQTQIVKAFDQDMVAAFGTTEDGGEASAVHVRGSFFRMMKQLTLTGYFTSEVGATQALHFQMIPGRYDGCIPIQALAPSK